jgi:hypothetical protein
MAKQLAPYVRQRTERCPAEEDNHPGNLHVAILRCAADTIHGVNVVLTGESCNETA